MKINHEEEEDDEEDEDDEDDEEDEDEVYIKKINGKQYYITNEKNSDVYEVDEEEDVGDIIGEIKNGKLILFK